MLLMSALTMVGLATTASAPEPRSISTVPAASAKSPSYALETRFAPTGAFLVAAENVEGALLIKSTLFNAGHVDTTGSLVLDTGAGYLALDGDLIVALGLADSIVQAMTFAPRPLRRMQIGAYQQDAVGPVLSIETEVIEQAIDRRVFGLLGQQPLGSFAVRIDYRKDTLALVPMPRDGVAATRPRRTAALDMAASSAALIMARNSSRDALRDALEANAVCLPFELAGDGKILISARLGEPGIRRAEPAITLVLDTGATKTVLFEKTVRRLRGDQKWKELRGLSAPTLYGSEVTYLCRVPAISLGSGASAVVAREVDVAVMASRLEGALSEAVQRPVDGLIGYSFLRRFRVTIDYPHRVLWLEPINVARDQRTHEYSHVGLQIERRDGALRVVAVATNSPADESGVLPGDEFVTLEGAAAGGFDVVELSRRLEGAPGSRVSFRLRRGLEERTYRLIRRQLL
ncbi:MAG: aspartyl protease family protein [Candidatus Eisenbacteria bacterium]